MNTFWLKVAGVGVLAVAVLIVAGQFTGGDKKSGTQEASPASSSSSSADVYEQDAKDHAELNAPIQTASNDTPPVNSDATGESAQPESAPVPPFVQLTEDQQVAADDLWQMAETQYKIGRKPMMTFGLCVKYCRQIIEQFPGSEYAIKAKRVLNDIVEINDRYKEQFHITDKELDMGPYK